MGVRALSWTTLLPGQGVQLADLALFAPTPTSDALERITMQASRFVPISAALLVAVLASPAALPAQEIVEITDRDQRIDPEFEEVFRVGVLEGESWEMFAEVSEVAFDAEGNLYVFDGTSGLLGGGSQRVLLFDVAGSFVREFGSSGGGPGEFNRPNGFAVLRDGTVVVSDVGHRAFQLLDSSGGLIRMVRVGDDLSGMSVLGEILPDPRGAAVFAGAFGGPGVTIRGAGAGPVAPPTSRPVMHVGLAGETMQADTLVHGWLPTRGEMTDLAPNNLPARVREMLANMSMPTVFEPEMLVGVLPDGGIVHSDSSSMRSISPPGRNGHRANHRRPFQPEPVTPEVDEGTRKGGRPPARLRHGHLDTRMMVVRGWERSRSQSWSSDAGILPDRGEVLPRSARAPRACHLVGWPHLGATPGRTPGEQRTHRCRDCRWGLRRHLLYRRDGDAGRLRPEWTGGFHRA